MSSPGTGIRWLAGALVCLAPWLPGVAQERIRNPRQYANRLAMELRLAAPKLVEALSLSEGSTVAVFGLGDRLFLEGIADRLGPDGRLHIVHREESLYRKSAELIAKFGRRIRPILATDANAHLEPDSVDTAVVIDREQFLSFPAGMFEQAGNALRPGGRMMLLRKPGQPDDTDAAPGRVERITLQAAGFRLVEGPDLLPLRHVWILEYRPEPAD